MNRLNLTSFAPPTPPVTASHRVGCDVELFNNANGDLLLRFSALGPCGGYFPDALRFHSPGQRKDHLWESTCFEAFLQVDEGPAYWEFNLSPAGDWNLYHFDDTRQGMMPELRVSAIHSILLAQAPDRFELECRIPVHSLFPPDWKNCRLGITAVLKNSAGELSYWALKHAGKTPDFHLKESFIHTLRRKPHATRS